MSACQQVRGAGTGYIISLTSGLRDIPAPCERDWLILSSDQIYKINQISSRLLYTRHSRTGVTKQAIPQRDTKVIFSRALITQSQHRSFRSHNFSLSLQVSRSDLKRRHGYAIDSRCTDLHYLAADNCPEAALSQPTRCVPARAAQVPLCPLQLYSCSFEASLKRKSTVAGTHALRSSRQSGQLFCA